jgi:hypothetical protein
LTVCVQTHVIMFSHTKTPRITLIENYLENCRFVCSDVSVSKADMKTTEDVFWDVTPCSLVDALPALQDKY